MNVKSLLLAGLALAACGVSPAPTPRQETGMLPALQKMQGVHPRLLITAEKQLNLKASLGTTHKWLWARFLQDLPHMVAVSRRTEPLEDVRTDGDLAADLAFAWLMTGQDSLLEIARRHVLRLTDPASWEAPGSLVYLIGSHFLMGISLAYDWLYPALTPAERSQIAACLGREAEAQYQSIVSGRIWWRNQYFQNHSQSNFCGLAFAAAALYGENERASLWLESCGKFFDKIYQIMPVDGSSVEGYAYAGYGGEYILKYAMLARDLLGRDYTGNPWMKHYTEYMVQGLLPRCTKDEWAMTYGDAPRRGWTSTAQHLFLLAGLYRDSTAQWMGKFVTELSPRGLGSHGWMMLLYYDPTVGEADPSTFPTFSHFPEIDQVLLRSAWNDTTATLIGFKCGPFMGRTYSRTAPFDWGSGHQKPDAGEFQVFARGQFLAIDPLYPGFKLTADHNTMLFKGQGQLGDELPGFASAEALQFGHYPQIINTYTSARYDYVVAEVAAAYHPALGLKRFTRHVLFIKPDILALADQLRLEEKGAVFSFPAEKINTGGALTHAENGYVIGPEGEAWVIFNGPPGTYQLTACYLDNVPGAGNYSFEVDGRTVHTWQSRNQDRDDNLIVVSPPVELKTGSRVAFCASPMSEGTRLTKLTAFSDQVAVPRKAQWLLHLDPKSVLTRRPDCLEAALGGAVLDLYCLKPDQSRLSWEDFKIEKGDLEPFDFRNTTRIVITPAFPGSEATILTLMQVRAQGGASLKGVTSTLSGGRARISWSCNGKKSTLDWDLQKMEALLN